jgi:hypothetical protein
MSRNRLRGVVLAAALILASPFTLTAGQAAQATERRHPSPQDSAKVVLDWERILFSTVYPATPIPSGVPILGFTSTAMYDAAETSARRGRSSETAAVATAAHDVLVHYVPAAKAALDTHLATSLATVQDTRAREKGMRIGREAAADMLASRRGDGYGDPDVHYTLPPGVGVWQPTPGQPPIGDMLGAWIGRLRPLMVDPHSPIDGPDPLTSAEYAADYNEVRLYGGTAPTLRTQAQTDIATFFNSNSAVMVGDALVRRLEVHPMGVVDTARIFAAMHASMTDSLIQCWRLKLDGGFWRPFQAINSTLDDGNPATAPQPGWAPLLPQPPYPEYVSGHGCLTSPAVHVIRETLGEDTPLELRSVNPPPSGSSRVYTQLAHIEYEAFHARIWGGFHFRDGMVDAYIIGHDTAERVLDAMEREHR